jgi:recombination protein RecR
MIPPLFKKFVQYLDAFPEIGPRQSWRLLFWYLKQDSKFQSSFIEILTLLKDKSKPCKQCFFPSLESDLCEICRNERRDKSLLCLIARETDLVTLESLKKYNGLYFVLGSLLLPYEDKEIIKDRLKILKERLETDENLKEVIVALPFTKEAEPTYQEIDRVLQPFKDKIKISKLRRGMPAGGEVEFLDPETLTEALLERE